MGELQDRLNSFILSATEVRDLTGWPDAMVEDYLNILRNILEITQVVEGSEVVNVELDQLTTKNDARISKLQSRINKFKAFVVVPVTANVIAKSNQILICKNVSDIDVTLDTNAMKNDEIHIKRRGTEITVIGSIDGYTFKIINVFNYSMHLVFDGTDWSEI